MKWLLDILAAIVTAVIRGLKKSPEEKQAEQVQKDRSAWQKEYDDAKIACTEAEKRWRLAVAVGDSSVNRLHAEWFEACDDLNDVRRAGQRAGFLD
jgi:hypothetical protein